MFLRLHLLTTYLFASASSSARRSRARRRSTTTSRTTPARRTTTSRAATSSRRSLRASTEARPKRSTASACCLFCLADRPPLTSRAALPPSFTCAVDTNMLRVVMAAVSECVLRLARSSCRSFTDNIPCVPQYHCPPISDGNGRHLSVRFHVSVPISLLVTYIRILGASALPGSGCCPDSFRPSPHTLLCIFAICRRPIYRFLCLTNRKTVERADCRGRPSAQPCLGLITLLHAQPRSISRPLLAAAVQGRKHKIGDSAHPTLNS